MIYLKILISLTFKLYYFGEAYIIVLNINPILSYYYIKNFINKCLILLNICLYLCLKENLFKYRDLKKLIQVTLKK